MNNSYLKMDIREVVKSFNRKMIESNPRAGFLQREYRLGGWNNESDAERGELELKFEVREEFNTIYSRIESIDDRIKIQMLRLPLN
jgi:serine/threonine-protein kinase RIO1